MQKKERAVRIWIVGLFLATILIALFARSYVLQVSRTESYQEQADAQYVRSGTSLYDRGSIFFTSRDGTLLSAAAIQTGYVLAVDPTRVNDAEQICASLAEITSVDQEVCQKRATLSGRTYVELIQNVEEGLAGDIRKLDIPALQLVPHQWRYYPGDDVSARVIGFVGHLDGDMGLVGKYGLERQYDDVLFRNQNSRHVNFYAELFTNLGDYVENSKQVRSGDVVTTLEPSVSRMLDTVLEETHTKYDSDLTGAIVMRPDTGEIVAMSALPGFDINSREGASIEHFGNPSVENVYEFGSTIKALTMAAGLDSGVVTVNSSYYDAGYIEFDKYTISNFDGVGRGTVPIQEVLNQSLNTGVVHIMQLMGKSLFRDYFLSFKLGSETGIDLPAEIHGLVSNLHARTDIEYATASFGQGIALTPIAATRALATLANDGVLVTPHIVRELRFTDGTTKEMRYPAGKQVLKPETSEEISRMLSVVVDEALRKGEVALPDHSIAAKTGTAQIPDPVNGGYYEDKFLHSFFGYFPAYDPEFIIFLYTVEPKEARYASETLTDPFMAMTEFLINYYSIPPDR